LFNATAIMDLPAHKVQWRDLSTTALIQVSPNT
jgi:hypothetical protein